MKTSLFDYSLSASFIAQQPAEPRDSSRLLVLDRSSGAIEHRRFSDIHEYLRSGDLLIANDSRVIPARLHARKPTGGKVEVFLLRRLEQSGETWECLVKGRGLTEGSQLFVEAGANRDSIHALVTGVDETGIRTVRFSVPLLEELQELGEIPLPPYITEYTGDRERYQTVFSRQEGSVAAPTAGLHFTPELLIDLRRTGVQFDMVTLHVGLDTFQPVASEDIEDHVIHTEWAELPRDVARRINDVTLQGGRIVAVGTTSVRTLEWSSTGAQGIDPYDAQACPWQRTAAFAGPVDLFIRPGYRFRAVDVLITNFHLPRSSLLMLVSAFVAQAHPQDIDAGRRILLQAYEEAKREGYRFFSFGDAMLII
ncbi:MAG: tRNA preQ1(34) S-adenosylmethionine ribosyltransferase-isomerase QueA [Chloroflexota bacterium]|jgi:S-adenosylmethionine:tRNA ribosyltransferase-isomerase|nr:tRNA preQ1(34) S-adenosylmethionine ribosyltransferase-isomerase QueA [Chloroflexota bacterium]